MQLLYDLAQCEGNTIVEIIAEKLSMNEVKVYLESLVNKEQYAIIPHVPRFDEEIKVNEEGKENSWRN